MTDHCMCNIPPETVRFFTVPECPGLRTSAACTLVRTRTKQRMKRRLQEGHESYLSGKIDAASMDQQVQSYLGVLSHANQHDLSEAIKNAYWVRDENGEISAF